MARRPRIEVPGYPLHIIQRGNNRAACFFADTDYRFFLKCLGEAASQQGCAIHAYVLMTNHVHLLVTPQAPLGASLMMQQLGRRYVRVINDRYRRSGTLWEGRFKASLVDSENYLMTCHRYIELNPVRAGMVRQTGGYRWSSHAHYAEGRKDGVLTEHQAYLRLGATPAERQLAFRALFDHQIDADTLIDIRQTANQGWPLGSEQFRKEIERVLRRPARPPKRGRPPTRESPPEGRQVPLID